MIALSNSKLPPIDVGRTVIVRVPDVDRGRLAPRNVLAVVNSVLTTLDFISLERKMELCSRCTVVMRFTLAELYRHFFSSINVCFSPYSFWFSIWIKTGLCTM
ncbi:uncharacterized protein LOC115878088 [Sitophilus oryzae]|uniref:Uncharacterized protein LOC115878088 n=1 Tax=Sitophilus oryzae TaxID=7048 RepID=A0A6J2XGQ0_SITOR|nr:uncharacterized protein LOC115878088 [Sitophilus oryzae]